MVSRSPSDVEQRFAVGAAGIGESGLVCIQRIHPKENLQRVQIRPTPLCYKHSCCVTGDKYILVEINSTS